LVPLEETTDSFTGKRHVKGLPKISEYRQDGDIKTGFGVGNCTYQFAVDLLFGLYDEHSIKQQIS